MTTITYENWKNNDSVLLYTLEIPETRCSKSGVIRLGVVITPNDLEVRVESNVEATDIFEGIVMSRLREQSKLGGPSAHYVLREAKSLKDAIDDCAALKAAFELLINRRTNEDRAAFERSLQGQ